MSDDTNTETKPASSKSPTHYAYHVRDGKGEGKGYWNRIGAAWQHKDGNGFKIQVDVFPLDGCIQLRIANEKK
jgi:hypothetical protein